MIKRIAMVQIHPKLDELYELNVQNGKTGNGLFELQ